MADIDLHTHSAMSDGTDAPRELVRKAASIGLKAVALTDHDTVAGVAEAMAAGREFGVEVVPGIEISSDYKDENVHVLGYYIDTESESLRHMALWAAEERDKRNRRMAENMAADGFDISYEALLQEFPGAILGRPHFCEHLMRKGYVSSIAEGFQKLLGSKGPYYLPKKRLPLATVAKIILDSGGIPVLAHPLQYKMSEEELFALLDEAQSLGIQRVEGYYSEHGPVQQAYVLNLAAKRGMALSGGSDYHGTRKPAISLGTGMGNLSVPYFVLDSLKSDLKSGRAGAC